LDALDVGLLAAIPHEARSQRGRISIAVFKRVHIGVGIIETGCVDIPAPFLPFSRFSVKPN
jgi:hypothetical protein